MSALSTIPLAEIEAARSRIAGAAVRTPLVPLHLEDAPSELHLKLENLQPIGSFKIRGASNAMAVAGPEALADGVYTASAGNMAQGVAWNARRLGIPCQVVVPDHAPGTKLAAIERLGGEVIAVPVETWWRAILEHRFEGAKGVMVHPVSDPAVIAGNGTIGLEILDDLPDVDAVVVPYGGGGLSSGIASAVKAKRPEVAVYASEVETGAPLAASLEAGRPVEVPWEASFVDGISSRTLLEEMWPLVRDVLDGSLVVSVADAAAAVRTLALRARVVAEGAGASSLAAALQGTGHRKVVCVISGGNIDAEVLCRILQGASG